MKPPIPTPEPVPVQTLRRYGLNATADEVAEVYRQHGELVKALESVISNFITTEAYPEYVSDKDKFIDLATCETRARDILTTATQKKG